MLLVINKKTKKEEVDKFIRESMKKSNAGFDAKKYCGVIKLDKDPLEIQNEMRNEWK